MEENKNINRGSSDLRDKFKMDAPENAWSLLSAELERKQAIRYKQRGNRFKLLSIGLALLLVSFITYYYLGSSDHAGKPGNATNNTVAVVNDAGTKPLTNNKHQADNTSGNKTLVSKGRLGTRNMEHSAPVPRSLSVQVKQQVATNEVEATKNGKKEKTVGDVAQNTNGDGENIITDTEERNGIATTPATAANDSSERKDSKESNRVATSPTDNLEKQAATEVKPAEPVLVNESSQKSKSSNNDSKANENSTHTSRWAIAAFYSPNYYAQNHLTVNNPQYNESTEDYSAREKAEYSFTTGLALRYDLTAHWSVSVGGNYSTIAYSINLPTVYAKYGSDDQLYYVYPTSCGNIEMPNTSNKVLYYGDSLNINGACRQVVEFINIPVTVRYRATSNRFTFYADAGFSANFVVQEKANVSVGNTETTIINNIEGLNKMNYGYLFGGGVEYAFYNGLGIFIEPCYRGSITSLTQNTAFYCYPNAFSLNMGVSFHF